MTLTEEQPQNAESTAQSNSRKPKRHRTLAQKWRLVSLPNKLIVLATLVIAVSNGAYTFVALRTLREIKGSSSDTHSLAETGNLQISVAQRIAKADEDAAASFKKSVEQSGVYLTESTRRTALDMRPWLFASASSVALKKDAVPMVVNEAFYVRLTTKNNGRTPAIKVREVVVLQIVEVKPDKAFPEPNFTYEPSQYMKDGIIPSGGDQFSDAPTKFDEGGMKNIIEIKWRLYIHGRVEYEDIFGVKHWTNFCSFLVPGGAYAVCPYHNDIDHNEPPRPPAN
jgi:hypothetical protein